MDINLAHQASKFYFESLNISPFGGSWITPAHLNQFLHMSALASIQKQPHQFLRFKIAAVEASDTS